MQLFIEKSANGSMIYATDANFTGLQYKGKF